MKALLLFKQRVKDMYSQVEVFLLPFFKFLLAFAYFYGINSFLGYMTVLNSPFIVLILSLLCAILPWNVIMYVGFALIIGHCYALNLAVAIFVGVVILFMLLMFLRFSKNCNIVLVFSELVLGVKGVSILPIGVGLLSEAAACLPAGCGVILYYFLSYIVAQESVLQSSELDSQVMLSQVKTLADGLVANRELWLTVVAVIAVILLVNLVRKASFDYAWRVSIVLGGIAYILIMLGGGLVLEMNLDMLQLIISTAVSVVIGLILEFFVFGGDYTRTERLQYEDDDYYYYVKAVPKSNVTTKSRSIKKINSSFQEEEDFDGKPSDFEKQLEESLKDL